MTAGPWKGWPIGAAHQIAAGADPEVLRAQMIESWEMQRDTASSDETRTRAEAEIARIRALSTSSHEG